MRSDYTLPALIDVYVATGHRDSALVAATRFKSRAVFGIDAQDAWLRNLLTRGRIAEQLGQMDVATTAYAVGISAEVRRCGSPLAHRGS